MYSPQNTLISVLIQKGWYTMRFMYKATGIPMRLTKKIKKRIFFVLLFSINSIFCFADNNQIMGVWIYKDLYDNWKSGIDDELIVPGDIVVNNTIYIGFPHSIIIDDLFMAAPGARWNITKIEKREDEILRISLSSTTTTRFNGYIDVIFISDNVVIFANYNGDSEFINSCEQSFLLFGDNDLYHRADRLQ
jgi:hypothetical protein